MDAAARHRLATAVATVSVVLAMFLAVWVATAGPALDWSPNDGSVEPVPRQTEGSAQAPNMERCAGEQCGSSDGLFAIIALVVIVVVGILLLIAVVVLFWSKISVRRRRPGARVGPGVPLPDVGDAVREDAEQQYAALRAGAPRNAIVACWVRLEDAVMSAGLTVRGSETSTELTQRVLTTYLVDDAALRRLAALYREARFSRHDISEAMRAEAVDALGELHDSLANPIRSGGDVQ